MLTKHSYLPFLWLLPVALTAACGLSSLTAPQMGASSPSPSGSTQGASASNSTSNLPTAPGAPSPAPTSPGSAPGSVASTTTTTPAATAGKTAGPTAPVNAKKGAALWYFGSINTALADVNAAWFYTWRANASGITAPTGVPFVPIWGPAYVDATDLASAKASGDTLLGFNEPDHPDQSNMTVQQALSLWPQLMATGQRLGAPATAADPSQADSWLEQFMAGAKTAGYRVDFICLHWYGSGTDPVAMTTALQTFVQNAYAKYQLPIWITEYSLINYTGGAQATPAQEAAFATASMAMLDTLSYVERYSWYALPPQGKYSLYNNDGSESVVGTAYKAGT